MDAVSAGSGPSAASALSLETAASVDEDPSTSPDQCSPSAPFHCAAEPSIQTVAAAHSIDAASSAVRTGPAVAGPPLEAAGTGPVAAALSLEAAGAATAQTVRAATAVDAQSSSVPPIFGKSLLVEDVAQAFYNERNSRLTMTRLP